MTNQASELYELCKEVYELTNWGEPLGFEHAIVYDDDDKLIRQWTSYAGPDIEYVAPEYTSDYLLEKLPKRINVSMDLLESETNLDVYYGQEAPLIIHADTPLKALLKLIIALSEAGELNDQSS